MAEAKKRSSGRGLLLGLIGITVVGTIAAIGGLYALLNQDDSVEAGTVVELTLDGAYPEAPTQDPFAELGLGGSSSSLWDLRRGLRAAADDDNVSALFVTVRTPALGFAQHQELAAEMVRFKDSGKPLHVLVETDMVDDGIYYAASSGARVWASPEMWWMVNGLNADFTFWRGTLDKLKIVPDVVMFKEYKSAGEGFANYEMSDPMREAMTDVLGDLQNHWLDDVATRRSVDRNRLSSLVDEGMFDSKRALDVGLIDDMGYRDNVVDALKEELGVDEYTGVSFGKYLKTVKEDADNDERVALIFGEGPIVAAPASNSPFGGGGVISGPTLAKTIRKAAKDDSVKAIVFRVNSPGGSAVGSDLVWREIEKAQEAGKPVVVSMSSVAGSGGYWVAMGSDAIVAHPTTITGSIGVVFTKFNMRGFYSWIGANMETLKFSENSDLLSPYDSLDEAQLARVTASMEATYMNFVSRVAEGRGSTPDAIEPLAHGRIYSGGDAKELGLVDELGGLDVAIARAMQEAELDADATDVVVYPKRKDFFQQLLEGELGEVRTSQPTLEDLEAALVELATPKVQVLMPEFTVR
ncbi:MAG: signal peptide peptidase SppA [Myxococcales bacterium]|nr:signal peptide peptidase SppA [Myxococcales bacterium]